MKTSMKTLVLLAIVVFMASCMIQNHDYSTLGPGDRMVNAVLILDPVEDVPNVVKIRQKILFDFDSYKLDVVAESTVKSVAALMKEHPDTEIALDGHTDKYGSDDYNIDLSISRANAVADALMANGVSQERIISVNGWGKQQLLKDLSNRENRRVLILSIGE